MTDLPPTLDHFGAELERAVSRDLRSRRTRRRVFRGAAVLAVAAAAALGLLSALPSGGPSIVQRAAAALESSDSILHYQIDAVQQNGDGTSASWSTETWQLRVPPYTRRQIEVEANAPRAESLTRGGLNELYDSGNDTIYIATSKALREARMPTIEIVPKSELVKLTESKKVDAAYEVGKGGGPFKVIATEEGAARIRSEFTHPQGQTSGVLPEEFHSALALLKSGRVRVTGHVVVDGRDAIRLESLDGKKVYIVDATTYDPIEWSTTGDGGGVTLRFPVYEELPVDPQSMQLLDLETQHPNAQVVHDVKAYIAAESRLYPHG
jgi:hypothetical protein